MNESPDEQAGLGDYVEWASADTLMDELLNRSNYGACVIVQDGDREGDPEKIHIRYKANQQIIDDHGEEGAAQYVMKKLMRMLKEST